MSNILGQSVECDSEIIVEALRERKETLAPKAAVPTGWARSLSSEVVSIDWFVGWKGEGGLVGLGFENVGGCGITYRGGEEGIDFSGMGAGARVGGVFLFGSPKID
jgi:hypothetical protein